MGMCSKKADDIIDKSVKTVGNWIYYVGTFILLSLIIMVLYSNRSSFQLQ